MEIEKHPPRIPEDDADEEDLTEFPQEENPDIAMEPDDSSTLARVFSQAEYSEIIKRATEIELAKRAIVEQERQFSFEDIARTGQKLGLPHDVLQRAADELKLKRNAITLTGDYHEVKKRVTAWLVSQSPTGTKLETVSENEILLWFPAAAGAPASSLEKKVSSLKVNFDRVEEGLTMSWKTDYSRLEKGISRGQKSGAGAFAGAILAGLLQLLNIAAIGELFFPLLLWAIAFGLIMPYFARKGKIEADEKIANMMSSAKELQQLEGTTQVSNAKTAAPQMRKPGK